MDFYLSLRSFKWYNTAKWAVTVFKKRVFVEENREEA